MDHRFEVGGKTYRLRYDLMMRVHAERLLGKMEPPVPSLRAAFDDNRIETDAIVLMAGLYHEHPQMELKTAVELLHCYIREHKKIKPLWDLMQAACRDEGVLGVYEPEGKGDAGAVPAGE